MTPEPSPLTNLDGLTAAVLQADPGARVLDRSPRAVRLKCGDSPVATALLLLAGSREELAAEVRDAVTLMRKGTILRIVAVDTAGFGAKDVLKEQIGALQVRSVIQALTWSPGGEVEVARGAKWPVLEQAVKALPAITDPAAIMAERESRGADADEFLAQLRQRKPVVTYAVAALSVVLFGLQMLWGQGEAWTSGMRMGASLRTLIESGQVWRLLAPMVLHGNIVHLLMNMLALFGFGTFLERFLGWRRYLALYVLSGLGGGIASFLRPGDVVSVGASGGIWGLMIAGAVLVTWPSGRLPELISAAQRKRAWSPVIINGLYSLQPGIDLFAHFGGGLFGGLLMLALIRGLPKAEQASDPSLPPRTESLGVTLLAGASAALLLAAIVASFVTGRPWELTMRPKLTPTPIAGEGATISLPALIGPSRAEGPHQYLFSTLQYDPVAFVVLPQQEHLTAGEVADPKAALQGIAETFNAPGSQGAPPWPGFARVGKFEVREQSGRPYLIGVQAAPDGRRAETYWIIDGDRFGVVTVVMAKGASPGWRAAAAEVPFTLKFD